MNKNNLFGEVTSLVANGGVIMGISTMNEILQTAGFILAIISGIMSIVYSVFKWYKVAKADGKITLEEVEQGIKDILPQVEKVVEIANNKEDDLDGNKNK